MTWAARIPTLAGLRYPQASFVLDFANNYYRGSGAQGSSPSALPGYNFTRALAAYAEDTAGNLIQFASGVPRITNKGVLIEESRTNYVIRSQTFSNAAWTVNISATVSDNSVVAPDGTLTATTITSGGAGKSGVYQFPALGSGVTATFSLYFKSTGSATSVRIGTDSGPVSAWLDFDPTTATITAAGPSLTASGIIPAANGWYRAWGTFVTTAATQSFVVYSKSGAGSTLVVWGAQLEAGSFPTSYIPTTSASVTRPVDVFYYSGLSILNVSTIAGSGIAPQTQTNIGRILEITDGSGNGLNIGAGNSIHDAYVGGTGITSAPVGDAVAFGVPTISVASNASGSVRGSGNGKTASALVGTATISTATRVTIGDVVAASRPLNGYIQRLAIYPFAASDAQLQSISSGNF